MGERTRVDYLCQRCSVGSGEYYLGSREGRRREEEEKEENKEEKERTREDGVKAKGEKVDSEAGGKKGRKGPGGRKRDRERKAR